MKHRTWLKFLLPVVLFTLMALLGRVPGTAMAAADAPSADSTQIVRGNVTFTIPADQCAQLPAGVSLSGSGKRYAVITTGVKGNGKTLTINNDFVQGTAQDSNGGTYDFVYANQDRHLTPTSGGPIHVNMTDVFTLSGNGGANNFTVAFRWTWTYTPPEQEWPPVTNWQQHYTLGDPFTCDPI